MMNAAHLARVDLNLLLVLDELFRTRSTTLAAKRLGKTQSAVSHALGRLRRTLRDPLFVRSGARLEPTALAEEMQPQLERALASIDALVSRSTKFEPARLERTFTIGGTDYAEMILMPRLIPALRKEAPGVTVATRFLGDDIDRALVAREIDLAYGTRFKPMAGIVEQRVAHEGMLVLVRRGHAATKKPFDARAYAELDHVLVTPREQPGGAVDRALEELGLSRRVVLRLPHFAAAAMIVAQTDLVVTLPATFASTMARAAPLETLPFPLKFAGFPVKIAFAATMKDDPAHAWFRKLLLEAAHAH